MTTGTASRADDAAVPAAPVAGAGGDTDDSSHRYTLEIFLVCFSSLLLEISYTRIVSYKLFYYFTYLVIGLALLGLGAGGVFVAVSKRLQRGATSTIVTACLLAGAVAAAVGYLVVALIPVNTLLLWDYDTESLKNAGALLVIAFVLFASFLPAGIILSTVFGRQAQSIGRLYFADLAGAALACALAVPLMSWIGPPAAVMLAGLTLTLAAVRLAFRDHRRARPLSVSLAGALAVLLAIGLIASDALPDVRTDGGKTSKGVTDAKLVYSSWSPLFRVDVREIPKERLRFFIHDGLPGSIMLEWDGKRSSLRDFHFEETHSDLPFAIATSAPDKVLIIGAAAGHDILVSLHRDAREIDAVELNPVTHHLVSEEMAEYAGHVAQQPGVDYVLGDGRSYLAQHDGKYDLIWFPAPDSYSATNASSASAFVLAESYLYTAEAVEDSLEHLAPGGVLAAQFGEVDFRKIPNRTVRYLATVRKALAREGVTDPARHFIVASSPLPAFPRVSTILVKKEPFTAAEVERFRAAMPEGTTLAYAPGVDVGRSAVQRMSSGSAADLERFSENYPFSVGSITDDKPFFWHFKPFTDVARQMNDPINTFNLEVAVGERVLIVLLGIAALLSVLFLLAPFVLIRERWRQLPRKGRSVLYFGAIGFGFMAFEITMIQRLVLFLGYPTYSLTVTLSSLLIFVGLGALASRRFAPTNRTLAAMGVLVALLTAYLLVGLTPTTSALLDLPLGVRIAIAFLLLAPLGLCLGFFMPLGVRAVADLSEYSSEYVAWGWALNGFASVLGSVLVTMLAMTYGFQIVLCFALGAYVVALVALRGLTARGVVAGAVG